MGNDLELLHEGFKNELEELESFKQRVEEFALKAKRHKVRDELAIIISNLEGLCDKLYYEFENSRESEIEELEQDFEIVSELLKEKIDHEEKIYIKIKYGIDLTM